MVRSQAHAPRPQLKHTRPVAHAPLLPSCMTARESPTCAVISRWSTTNEMSCATRKRRRARVGTSGQPVDRPVPEGKGPGAHVPPPTERASASHPGAPDARPAPQSPTPRHTRTAVVPSSCSMCASEARYSLSVVMKPSSAASERATGDAGRPTAIDPRTAPQSAAPHHQPPRSTVTSTPRPDLDPLPLSRPCSKKCVQTPARRNHPPVLRPQQAARPSRHAPTALNGSSSNTELSRMLMCRCSFTYRDAAGPP